jgi:predicted deacetylase
MVQYLIRLDDLCQTSNLDKWARFFNLFDYYGIKPIVAVIPNNKDPKLTLCGSFNPNYWQLVRDLQSKRYAIAMHGFEHRYLNANSGILKQNKRSEFAGLPICVQERKIINAVRIFERENINSDIFVAPAHSFDHNTLKALKKYSNIRIISDGLLTSPYKRYGFKWIPVQLSEAEPKVRKTWTFNYHPETCSEIDFKKLEAFIHRYHKRFVSASQLTFRRYSFWDNCSETYRIYARSLRELVKTAISA